MQEIRIWNTPVFTEIFVPTNAVTEWFSLKEVFLKIYQNSQENTCGRVSFRDGAGNFIKKEALAQVFPWEFCEIFKNTFFNRAPPVAASDLKNLEQDTILILNLVQSWSIAKVTDNYDETLQMHSLLFPYQTILIL